MKRPRKTVECKDGFSMSVQADEMKYCLPRKNDVIYASAEVGYPSHYDFFLQPFAEDPRRPTDTVYGYVPAHIIRLCIESHGGMTAGELPPFTEDAWNGELE